MDKKVTSLVQPVDELYRELLKAKKAIWMVDEQAHMANLTDKVKAMLESKSE